MATLSIHEPSVNSMPPISTDRLKRDVAIHRAGNLLGIAIRARQEQRVPIDPDWCRTTFRALLEGFELETTGREPDAVVAARTEAERVQAERLVSATFSRLWVERSRGRIAAADRGHDLSTWEPGPLPGIEASRCQRCARAVVITIGDDPVLSGSALTEGCLTAAEGVR